MSRATATAQLPILSTDRAAVRRLAEAACPATVVWVGGSSHPEGARYAELPFVFASGRVRAAVDPLAAQRTARAGNERAVRELELLCAALLAEYEHVAPPEVWMAAVDYAHFVIRNPPPQQARLRGVTLAGWWQATRGVT